jgi:hypothetical protein
MGPGAEPPDEEVEVTLGKFELAFNVHAYGFYLYTSRL